MLQNKSTGGPAAFCGPILLHFRKTKATYAKLFATLETLIPGLELNAFGTDGEVQLIEALKEAYPGATQLRCYLHFEKNVSQYLTKKNQTFTLQMKANLKLLMTGDIEHFDERYMDLINKHPSLECYLSDKMEMMKASLHACNNNGNLFYTNASESVNAKLKTFTNHKKSDISTMLKNLLQFIGSEHGTAVDGYTGHSQTYQTSNFFADYFGDIGCWDTMNTQQRGRLLHQFNTSDLQHSRTSTHQLSTDFDLTPSQCHININPQVLQMMFEKADRILTDKQILSAPTHSNASYSLFSCTSQNNFSNYHVKVENSGQLACECRSHKIYSICSHGIAAAHYAGQLYLAITWHRQKHKSKSVDVGAFLRSTPTSTLTRAGLKGHQTVRKRPSKDSEKPVSKRNRKASCDVDHQQLCVFVFIDDHPQLKTCYKCLSPVHYDNSNGIAIGQKIYRSFRNRITKQPQISLKKQWAYCHIRCYDLHSEVHVCEHVTISPSVAVELHTYKVALRQAV